jgi:hypothetical protein
VTLDEFCDYYTDLSMSIASDEYFVRMMEAAWQCPEDDNDAECQKTVKNLVTEVRQRILDLSRGGDPVLVKKIFNDFDLNQSNSLTIDEFTGMIAKL